MTVVVLRVLDDRGGRVVEDVGGGQEFPHRCHLDGKFLKTIVKGGGPERMTSNPSWYSTIFPLALRIALANGEVDDRVVREEEERVDFAGVAC